MTLKHLLVAAAVAGMASLALSAGASAATTVTVQATTPFGGWLDTGLNLSAGATYDLAVNNPATLWSAGSDIPFPRSSTADGIPANAGYGQQTMAGYTFNFGALVGDVGGTLFLIGASPVSVTGLSGELTVGYWDSYYGDNSGAQSLTISAVPEPASWAMMLIGVGAVGGALRSRRKPAPVAA